LFLAVIVIQAVLVLTKLETKDEVKVIMLFHIIGFCLELFKTSPGIGSWSYPEEAFFKIAGVPLFSGFMYSPSVVMCRRPRRFLNSRSTTIFPTNTACP